ncbi:MAG TPA: glucose 1-dehydrogenase [Rhizomicrobium sp.]|jgi:NAD(P)-dependent dehydrogenase (short-subunit alcohol dehydrogenase family)|nr:glucose 1-dehydrogenase [Rhizomicrobium sp.]
MDRVKGKVALVTGGASGIGRASAMLLAKEGAAVVVTDIQDDQGKDVVGAIKKAGGDALYLHHDVASEEAWIGVVAETKARFGKLHILVNNAGIAIAGSVLTMTLADWRRQQAINLDGVFLGVKHSLPLLRASGGGSIVNISSLAGLKGSATLAGYCATKGGVRLFTKAVAMECGAARDNVRVNSVHPGIIETPIWLGIVPGANQPGANAPNLDAISETVVPIGAKGLPEDIAAGVLYLASDDSRYVTGSELVIDGGMSTR